MNLLVVVTDLLDISQSSNMGLAILNDIVPAMFTQQEHRLLRVRHIQEQAQGEVEVQRGAGAVVVADHAVVARNLHHANFGQLTRASGVNLEIPRYALWSHRMCQLIDLLSGEHSEDAFRKRAALMLPTSRWKLVMFVVAVNQLIQRNDLAVEDFA